jgi:chromosome partitioning protein
MANCIAFHSYKGGTGKTTIGANFAALLAKKGYRVFLLDLDVYAPSLQTYFNEKKPKKWINDFLFGNAEVDDILMDLTPTLDNYENSKLSSSSSKDKPNGKLMAGFSNSKREEIYKLESGGKQENSKMQLLRKFILLREQLLSSHDADYIIIDTSPGIRYWSINALAVADILFLTLKMDELDIEGTKTIAQEIYSSFTRHGTKSYLLLNRVAGYCTPHGMSLKNESMEEAAASRNSVTNIQNVGSSTIQMPKEQDQSDIINMLSKELKMDVISSIPCYCDIQFNKREYLTVLEYPHHPFAEKINSLIENLKAAKS